MEYVPPHPENRCQRWFSYTSSATGAACVPRVFMALSLRKAEHKATREILLLEPTQGQCLPGPCGQRISPNRSDRPANAWRKQTIAVPQFAVEQSPACFAIAFQYSAATVVKRVAQFPKKEVKEGKSNSPVKTPWSQERGHHSAGAPQRRRVCHSCASSSIRSSGNQPHTQISELHTP